MFAIAAQYLSIIFLHDFNPAITPWLHEDAPVLDLAYQIMHLL
mgnify:CR=1 FL=1